MTTIFHMARPLRRSAVASAALLLLLSGCAVGPDFKSPDAPAVADAQNPYTPVPVPAQTASAPGIGGASQHLTLGQDIPAMWWQMFHSVPLDELVRSSIVNSPTMAAAQAALRQAQETYNATYGNRMLPAVTGQLGASREREAQGTSGLPGGFDFNVYNASVNVGYTIDAFGGIKRQLEGLQASIDYQRFQIDATYMTLTANVVTTAIQEASLRAQIAATQAVVDSESQSLQLVQTQARLGAVALGGVLTQQAQLAQTQATIPNLQKLLQQTRHQLSVYAGRLPGDAGLPEFTIESLHLPEDLPVSLPSALVRQRPDIRASEALLHEASAQVGVATANLYPQITLSGSFGLQSITAGSFFNGSSEVWSIGAGLLQPIFNGGALQAQKRAAIAAYDQSAAQYRQTVLNAFLNVANTLRALDGDAQSLAAQDNAASLAKQSLDLVNRQYQLGAVNYLSILDAQRIYQQTVIALVQAQAARYADTAALFQALGGGWWNAPELASAAP